MINVLQPCKKCHNTVLLCGTSHSTLFLQRWEVTSTNTLLLYWSRLFKCLCFSWVIIFWQLFTSTLIWTQMSVLSTEKHSCYFCVQKCLKDTHSVQSSSSDSHYSCLLLEVELFELSCCVDWYKNGSYLRGRLCSSTLALEWLFSTFSVQRK